ncbi:MAG: transrane transport protein [Streptomyces oryziradicis]|nr:transrane transport protein [Actinacidiphila oryziradicis]
MGKLTVGALRAVLVVVLAGTVFVQALMVWALADPEDGSLPLTPLQVITILGMASAQVALVCVWRLVTMVRRGTVFSRAAFRYVDVVIGAIVAAALVWFAVTVLNAPGQRADPGVTGIMGGVGMTFLGVALIVLVLRGSRSSGWSAAPEPRPSRAMQPRYGYPQAPAPKKESKVNVFACLGCVVVFVIGGFIIAFAVARGVKQDAHTIAAAVPVAGRHTITYVLSGSGAPEVTYGPSRSDIKGSLPMHVANPMGGADSYSITAQLQGGGDVTCQIEVDGKVISRATATGGHNIVMCQIEQDPIRNEWINAN